MTSKLTINDDTAGISAADEAVGVSTELLAMIEERATAVETAKRDYEAHSIAQQQDHQAKLLADREALAEREKEGARRQQEQLAARVAEYDEALAELSDQRAHRGGGVLENAEGVAGGAQIYGECFNRVQCGNPPG